MITRKVFPFFFINIFILGLGANFVGPLIPILTDYFNVSFSSVGAALSLNAFGVLAATLFSGIISEKFGKKKALILGIALFIISFFCLYLSKQFTYFTLSYILFGISHGIIMVNSFSLINDITKLNKSRAIVILGLGNTLGILFAPILVSGALFLNINWRYLFLSVVLINIILLLTLILSVKIEDISDKESKKSFINLITTNRKLAFNLNVVLCGIIFFLIMGGGFTFLTWFTTYFKNLNVTIKDSSLLLSLFSLSFVFGKYFKSFLVTKFSEKKIILYFSILASAFLFISFGMELLIYKVIFILLFGFSNTAINDIALSLGLKKNPKHSGTITSIILSYGYMGVIIFQYITGYLTEKFSANSIIYITLTVSIILIVFSIILNYYYKLDGK